jgi:hypothetical protein
MVEPKAIQLQLEENTTRSVFGGEIESWISMESSSHHWPECTIVPAAKADDDANMRSARGRGGTRVSCKIPAQTQKRPAQSKTRTGYNDVAELNQSEMSRSDSDTSRTNRRNEGALGQEMPLDQDDLMFRSPSVQAGALVSWLTIICFCSAQRKSCAKRTRLQENHCSVDEAILTPVRRRDIQVRSVPGMKWHIRVRPPNIGITNSLDICDLFDLE